MSFARLRPRLTKGRPLVVDADGGASFRARGVELDTPGALGLLLRAQPAEVLAHYRAEVSSRVDVISALTADTTPRALAEVGMEHRAALLTGLAVELALQAAEESSRDVAVAGVLGSDMVTPTDASRLQHEMLEHAERVAAAGVELLIARGQGSHLGLMSAVSAGAETGLPIWAVVECGAGTDVGDVHDLLASLHDAGAQAVLFEVPSVDAGLVQLSQAYGTGERRSALGVLLASSPDSVRGFCDESFEPAHWVDRALDLGAAGSRIIGGGAGTTETHTELLAAALGVLHPSVPPTATATSA